MTDNEIKAKIKACQNEYDEVKKHRKPSGIEDSLAIETMQIKQREEPTLDVLNNVEAVLNDSKDGVIKVKDDVQKSDKNEKSDTERN